MLSAIDATISIRCSKSPLANWLTTLVIAQQHMISQWVGKKNSENIPATICIEDITFQRRKPIPFSFEQTIRRALFKRGYKVSENKNSWQQKMGVIKTYGIYVNKSKLSPNNKLAKEQEPLLRNKNPSFKPLQTCKGIKKHIHKT